MGGGALPAHGLAGRVEVSGLDAGAAGGGPVGEPVLAAFGLAWRAWLVSFLQGAALVLVVVWTLLVGLSVLCRDEAYSVVRKVILGVSICVVIGSAVTEGLFFWTFSTVEERVVASQDRTLVEEDRGFLDPFYVYYEYHSPLVRGARSVDVGVPYGECLQEDE